MTQHWVRSILPQAYPLKSFVFRKEKLNFHHFYRVKYCSDWDELSVWKILHKTLPFANSNIKDIQFDGGFNRPFQYRYKILLWRNLCNSILSILQNVTQTSTRTEIIAVDIPPAAWDPEIWLMNRERDVNRVRCGWPTMFMIISFPAAFRCETLLSTLVSSRSLKYLLSAAQNLVTIQEP